MSLYPYNSSYSPPMPVCLLMLGSAGEIPSLGPLEAIIDTGADITVIPIRYLRQLAARPIRQGTARSLWGDQRPVAIYAISLRLDNLFIRALQVLADTHGDEIVLGRSVLNRLQIILDGPTAQTEIVEGKTV